MKGQWKLIVSLIILILVVVFALQNTGSVQVDFFFAKYQIPLVLVILFSLLIGVIVGLIASFSSITIHIREKKEIQKELSALKESQLRELSDKDNEITHLRTQVRELKQVKKNTVNVSQEEVAELTPSMEIEATNQEEIVE
ncbi:LapA family protein [Aerococcaceae bacterium zg-ZJ1578]|uniref:LapA family protein n=1 Tax=Aerococcaceae bacterium zg-252 TaxID=2796928 RepID=UPI001A2D801D|nr:LapA family protein [Aerococcaceae bacterium zg-1578]